MAYNHDTKDPNLMNLHKAMVYDEEGEPSLRVSIEQLAPGVDLTITGDVIVTDVTGVVEISNDVGNPIPISATTETNSPTNPLYVSSSPTGEDGASSYFGERLAINLVPVVQLNSYEGVKDRDSQVYVGGGGTVVENSFDISVSCSSTLGSYGVYRTLRFIPYRAGQSNSARILCKFDTGLAGTQQRVGIANQESAYYIGYNGANFQFLHSYGGLATIKTLSIASAATTNQTITVTLNSVAYNIPVLSGDSANLVAAKISDYINDNSNDAWINNQVDNTVRLLAGTLGPRTGTYSITSTGNVTGSFTSYVDGVDATDEWEDLNNLPAWAEATDYQHWEFQYSWAGVIVYVLNPTNNRWTLVHKHVMSSGDMAPLPVRKPSFKISAVAYNTGAASGRTMYVASMAGFVEGTEQFTTYTNGGGVTKSSLGGNVYHHIMSVQNPYVAPVDGWKLNFRHIKFLDLTVAAQCNDPVELYIYFNGQLVNGNKLDFTSVPNRLFSSSVTTGTFDTTTDTPIVGLVTGISGSQAQFDLLNYNLIIPPGTHVSLVARSDSTIQKLSIAGVWGSIG